MSLKIAVNNHKKTHKKKKPLVSSNEKKKMWDLYDNDKKSTLECVYESGNDTMEEDIENK